MLFGYNGVIIDYKISIILINQKLKLYILQLYKISRTLLKKKRLFNQTVSFAK